MYARITTFEGGDADAIRAGAEEINSRSATGPPEGVPSVGLTFLIDPEGGRMMFVGLFKTMDDLKAGDAVLREMTPPVEGMGTRASVDVYEVAVDMRAE